MVAFTLWAVERHLDGRYRQAFVLGFLAALLRPEIWLFLGLYGLWLLLIDRSALWLVVGGWRARCRRCGSCRSGGARAT